MIILLYQQKSVPLHLLFAFFIVNMDQDLVSVIMPTYNSSKFLAESIDCVLAQTYKNLELIITDDCSTDGKTQEIIRSYAEKDSRVKAYFFKENQGPGCSRNKCIEMAAGRYIAFCDSDDRWLKDKLERQIKFLNEKDGCLTFSSYWECNEQNEKIGIVVAPEKLTLTDLKHDNKIGCLTALYDTTKFGKYYMPTIRKRQDWALFLTIMKDCKVAYAITEPLAYYRLTPGSVSRSKFKLVKYNAKVYQQVFGYSTLTSYAYLFFMFMPSYTYKVVSNKMKFREIASSLTKKFKQV